MITSRTARGPLERAGVERILGDAPDVSEWNNLEMNDLIWLEKPTSIAERSVGRRRESTFMASDRHSTPSGQQLLCYWVLPGTTGVPILIVGTTLRQVTADGCDKRKSQKCFDSKLRERSKRRQPHHHEYRRRGGSFRTSTTLNGKRVR